MSPADLTRYMTDLLHGQTEMIMKAISDLDAIRGDLPLHRQPEVDAIIQRLQEAANQDRNGLRYLGAHQEPN